MPKNSRRHFISAVGLGIGAAIARVTANVGAKNTASRHDESLERRRAAALLRHRRRSPRDLTNGDEDRYPDRVGNYSKGLPHNDIGQVDSHAYDAMLAALRSGHSRDFARIPLVGTFNLVNPQAAFTFTLHGADSHDIDLAAPPPLDSAEAAADMVEVYWQSRLRDVPFNQYESNDSALTACDDLSRLSGYVGPKQRAQVVPTVLFRGQLDGDETGPYISQFLYARIPHGVYTIEQRFRMPVSRTDYVTSHDEWLAMQRGSAPRTPLVLEPVPRFIRNGRDLARYVQRDYSFQAFLNAALFLIALGERYTSNNPYIRKACAFGENRRVSSEDGFCTFGGPGILHVVATVANLALHASWRQKWLLHRRLRPEEFAQRFDRRVNHGMYHPIHSDLLNSAVLADFSKRNLLLPLAYPEGAPLHPSYPAGHAAIAGACATILKAFFREDEEFPAPVDVSEDGLAVVGLSHDQGLTIGGEINKLASNISIGRDFAGVHYRTDAVEGIKLGEAVAIAYLEDLRLCLTEEFDGFTFTSFDGTVVNV
jgi:hypothetical protein